jgi:hypothetical protein
VDAGQRGVQQPRHQRQQRAGAAAAAGIFSQTLSVEKLVMDGKVAVDTVGFERSVYWQNYSSREYICLQRSLNQFIICFPCFSITQQIFSHFFD